MRNDGDRYHYAPELIVERADNVLVTGNIHPDVPAYVEDVPDDWEEYPYDNMGMRPGVHSRYGCVGGDIPDSVEIEDGKPYQLRDVMWDFIDPESIADGGEDDGVYTEDQQQQVENRLEELGYI